MDIVIMSVNGQATKSDEKIIHQAFGKENVSYDSEYHTGWLIEDMDYSEARIKCLNLRLQLSKHYVASFSESFRGKTPVKEYIEIYNK